MRLTLALCFLALTSHAGAAGVTYRLVDYAADQNGGTLSGYFTLRQDVGDFSVMDVLDWSVTISQTGVGAFTTGMNDPSAMLQPLGQIKLSATEMTIAPGAGWLWIQSNAISLSYNRSPDGYSGSAGTSIAWQSGSLGGSEPWVIARTLGAPAVPEPGGLLLISIAALCLSWKLSAGR